MHDNKSSQSRDIMVTFQSIQVRNVILKMSKEADEISVTDSKKASRCIPVPFAIGCYAFINYWKREYGININR